MSLPKGFEDFEFPVRPCVGSGHCCKTAPCPFGKPGVESDACIYLEPWIDDDLEGVQRYRCGRYEYIMQQPGKGYWSPSFGEGCCATLFNRERDQILEALERRRLKVIPDLSPGRPEPRSMPRD